METGLECGTSRLRIGGKHTPVKCLTVRHLTRGWAITASTVCGWFREWRAGTTRPTIEDRPFTRRQQSQRRRIKAAIRQLRRSGLVVANESSPARGPVGAASSASMALLRSFGFWRFACYKYAAPLGLGKLIESNPTKSDQIRPKNLQHEAIEANMVAQGRLRRIKPN